eukprot:1418622-Pyramimonas_sp.AAC.1
MAGRKKGRTAAVQAILILTAKRGPILLDASMRLIYVTRETEASWLEASTKEGSFTERCAPRCPSS